MIPLSRILLHGLWNRERSQIGILVPIGNQRRTNGTCETGSNITHLKAVPSKAKKNPKRGNFHSPLLMYLIRTVYCILAPTKHLGNFTIIVPIVFTRGSFSIVVIIDVTLTRWLYHSIGFLLIIKIVVNVVINIFQYSKKFSNL